MSLNLLGRNDSPFEKDFWDLIDSTVKSIAQMQLSCRKLLYTEGPVGLGLQFVPGNSRLISDFDNDGSMISIPQGIPLAQLSSTFSISGRDIEAYHRAGLKSNMQSIIYTVQKMTSQEDKLLFYGSATSGLYGLLTNPDIQRIKLTPWDQVGDAIKSIVKAIENLDREGFHGPYCLALSIPLFNLLFRHYPNSDILEIDHLKTIVSEGIIKSASITSGGVILASGEEFGSIVIGQDLMAGFEGPSSTDFVFTLSETIALRLVVPKSVCVLDVG